MERTQDWVLLVDDDREIRSILRQILTGEGYLVAEAANGAEAIEVLQKGLRPRLILLDLIMPKMDGRAFLAWQKKDPLLSPIPVVVLSGHELSPEKIRELGCCGQLSKLLDLEALLKTVRHHVDSRGEPDPAGAGS
jgi:CheY-like chemotaxis protein